MYIYFVRYKACHNVSEVTLTLCTQNIIYTSPLLYIIDLLKYILALTMPEVDEGPPSSYADIL